MPTSRPLRLGDLLINIHPGHSAGLWSVFSGGQQDPKNYVLMSDFGLEQHVWELVSERIFGIQERSSQHLAAAITNGTAPGLYVREGDDTSDWETYRQVLARRVEEAMAARRGEASGGETAREDAAALAAARAMPIATTRQDPADVRKVSSPPQTVADVSGIEAAVSDEVRRRISSPLVSDETTRQRVVSPVPPAPAVDVRLQFGGERETTASRIRQEVQRELDRQYGRIDASSSPSPPPTLPSPPSRFSLLEIDTDTDAKDASPSPSNAPVDLAALQAELRAEREARRALAAVQTPPGRFDLLECDLPAVPVAPVVAIKSPQPSSRPAASSPPPRRPVETITDLTAARSPLELARMLEGLNDAETARGELAMRIAITGHRPDKLGGYDASNPLRVHLRNRFKDVLLSLVADALTFRGVKPQDVEVYIGGALGFDTDAARVCAETAVPFVVAVPFPSQWKRWKPSDQAVYRNMLTYAKRVEYVSKVDPPKSDGVDFGAINMMYARNRYMVDRCGIVVSAWDGSRGGTGHCVDYARQKGKEIIVLVPGRVCQYGPNDIGIQGDKVYYINPQPVSNTL